MKSGFTSGRLAVFPMLLLSSSLSLSAAATHHHRGTATIDGIDSPLEWLGADAGSANMQLPTELGGAGGPVSFNIMNDDANWYVSMRFPYNVSPPSPAYLAMLVQAWNEGVVPCSPTIFEDDIWLFARDGGATFTDNFDLECLGDAPDDTDGGTTEGAVAMVDEGATLFFEISHPLDTTDNLHDLSTAASHWHLMIVNSTGCGPTECGTPAHLIRRVYFEPENYVFVGDFEAGDTAEWSIVVP